VVIHSAAMLLYTFAGATGLLGFFHLLAYSNVTFLHGMLWQPVTYVFVNGPSLGFVISMYMLWVFGRELERFFGRAVFLRLYVILVLITPLLCVILYPWGSGAGSIGCSNVDFAIFVAFATLYPNAVMLFGITAKWVAVILVGISALQMMSAQAFVELLFLAGDVGTAWAYVRWARGELTLPEIPSWRKLVQKKPRLYVVKPPPQASPRAAARSDSPAETIDALLDKIARSGLNSLTPAERAQLEQASAKMKERDGR
jgi:membrane associated rhomboid family serine protease